MREIQPTNNNGSIQLKFSVDGKRYCFNPVKGGDFNNKRDLAQATTVATQIQNDILAGYFDPTLKRYKPSLTPSQTPQPEQSTPNSLLYVWDAWVDTLDLSPETKADHYEMVRRMIVKAEREQAKPALDDISWLLNAEIAASTFNKRLGYLKSCLKWATAKGVIATNPFEKVKSRKVVKQEIKPFTLSEIQTILEAFDQRYPHYTPFVAFMLLTGVRTSEAIGLLWRHVDFDRNEIVIRESMPKDRTGNGYRRIRKETKTGNVRYLTMTNALSELLSRIKPTNAAPDDLVFRSAKGCCIDAGNFREDWVKVLADLKIPYRKPYTTRHTLLSHAIEQGIPITGVAYIAGHSDTRMVMQTYGHLVNRPSLPDIKLD